jgi:hypothetical protein
VDYLFLTTLEEIPALFNWVELCEEFGWMSKTTATDWRVRIEAWRRFLEQEQRGTA